jgi:hypothetical protein
MDSSFWDTVIANRKAGLPGYSPTPPAANRIASIDLLLDTLMRREEIYTGYLRQHVAIQGAAEQDVMQQRRRFQKWGIRLIWILSAPVCVLIFLTIFLVFRPDVAGAIDWATIIALLGLVGTTITGLVVLPQQIFKYYFAEDRASTAAKLLDSMLQHDSKLSDRMWSIK